VTVEQAQANLTAVSQRLEQQFPQNRGVGALVLPMHEDVIGDARTPLLVLLGAVSSLLLIGCASLANLLIARAVSRSSELVLRAALGAGRGRLIRQSLTELVPLLALGGFAGILLAHWLVSLTIPVLPATLPRVESIAINGPVMAFAAIAVTLTGLAIGIWPALQAGRWDIASALRESLRGTSTTLRGGRTRDALVIAQMAVAVTLLIASTLLMRSFATVKAVDPGFRADGVATMHLAIPRVKYPGDPRVAGFCRDILDRVRQLPGVRAAGMVNRLPLAGVNQTGSLELERSVFANHRIESADFRTITPGYLETMSIPLIEGRSFSDADHADAPLVGLIDARTAKAAWPNESPIGRRFRIGFGGGNPPWVTIVGVVGDIKHDGLTADQRPQFYWNYLQRAQDRMALVARTDGDPTALTSSIVAAIREVDPEQPVYDVRPLTAVLDRSVAQQWLTTAVLVAFAVLSLIVATVGVYGVVAYNVAQRAREFAVRMALGAARSDVLLMVMGRTARLVLAGTLIGTAGAFAASHALRTLLYGVAPTDWISYAAAIGALGVAALVATALPAARASRFNPSEVLRGG
jgi:predicted permease